MVVREAFKDLLKGWGRSRELIFVLEYEIATPAKDRRYVDSALVHALRCRSDTAPSFTQACPCLAESLSVADTQSEYLPVTHYR
jgi:hypothetical protein